eukprot:270094_1
MSNSFGRFLVYNGLHACYYNAASLICMRYNWLKLSHVLALDSYQTIRPNKNNGDIGLLSQLYDGLLFSQRNSKVPTKSNHGARPCSHVYRHIKVECKWYGPRWYRKRLKKVFRNSENKIHP